MDAQTNEAMPRFGGRVDPGQEVHLSVDGVETTIVPTPDGTWTYSVPELADGEHDFEMWTEDSATGDQSDSIEWTNDVQAGAEDRRWQRARNEEWANGGAGRFIDENDRLARGDAQPPRSMTGGGGGGGQPMTDPQPGSGSGGVPASSGAGGSTSAGPTGTGTGTGTATEQAGAPAAQGLEKGNAGFVVAG